MRTVGEAIEEKAQKYIDLYKAFLRNPELRDRAARIAEADLCLEMYIAEEALHELREYTEEKKRG